MTPDSLSATVARHIAGFPDSALPVPAAEATRRALLDAIGVMLAASHHSDDVQPFVTLARQSDGPCRILGHTSTTTPGLAAMANGAMAHALDFEDTFDARALHPNAAMIPAAMAMTEHLGAISGTRFITALAIGCDLVCRMGLALTTDISDRGWFPPLLLGVWGATAATARIAGLNEAATRDALSLALCLVSAPGAISSDAQTTLRATREAFAAEAAIKAVQLADSGVRGFSRPLEGPGVFFPLYADGQFQSAVLLDGLGTGFFGEQLSFKQWPACRGTHTFIEMALDLRQSPGFRLTAIERITVDTGMVQTQLVEPLARKAAPQSVIDAKFSIPFTVALALVLGRVTLEDFEAHRDDPAVLALAARIKSRPRPDWGRDKATAGAITVTFSDGRQWQDEKHQAAGHPSRPLSEQALVNKFSDCIRLSGTGIDAQRAAGEILAIGKDARAVDFAFLSPQPR